MAYNGYTGVTRVVKACHYSWDGLCAAFRSEAAFRQEVVLFLVLSPLALWFGDGTLEKALMLGSLFLVLIVELLNSGIEAVVDRFGHEYNELAKRAKDMGSAAVLLALINAVVIWVLLLIP